MIRCSGSVSSDIIEMLVSTGTSLMPCHCGRTGRPPTFMKICGASSVSPFTSIACGPVKRAWPHTSVSFSVPAIHFDKPSIASATTRSLRALTAFMSMVTGPPMWTP